MIVVRTHGGLGNQLFQAAQALVRARSDGGRTVRRIHDNRYKVKREASPAFADLDGSVPAALSLVSAVRVPKLLKRSGVSSREEFRLGSTLLLDGYFQRASDWEGLPSGAISEVLQDFRTRFRIAGAPCEGCLVHLRLGDFFASEAEERAHLRERLADVPRGATVISDRDDLLATQAEVLAECGARHLPTDRMVPEALLATMAKHAEIRSNDSTLGFWAALLGRGRVTLQLPRLRALMDVLAAAR